MKTSATMKKLDGPAVLSAASRSCPRRAGCRASVASADGDGERDARRQGACSSRSAVAGGPIEQCGAEHRADRERRERDGERERGEEDESPTSTHRDAAGGGELGAERAQQQRAVSRRRPFRPRRARARPDGADGDGPIANSEPKSTVIVAPVVLDVRSCRGRERARRGRGAAPSTMPVARSRPRARRMPSSSIAPARDQFIGDEAPERAHADEERARASGRAEVGERVARRRTGCGSP